MARIEPASKRFITALEEIEEAAVLLDKRTTELETEIESKLQKWSESSEAKNLVDYEISKVYDEEKLNLILNLIIDCENHQSLQEVMILDNFKHFDELYEIPPKLKNEISFVHFYKYVKALSYKESLPIITERIKKIEVHKYKEKLLSEDEVRTHQDMTIKLLCDSYGNSLAISDHERIRINFQVNSIFDNHTITDRNILSSDNKIITSNNNQNQNQNGKNIQIVSHNVQERKLNGITTFISAFQFLNKMNKTIRQDLTSIMLHDEITIKHIHQILTFIKEQFDGRDQENNDNIKEENKITTSSNNNSIGCILVCLQEMSADTVNKLKQKLNIKENDKVNQNNTQNRNIQQKEEAHYIIHSSQPTNLYAQSSMTSCEAMTCIVTTSKHPCRRLQDVTVNYVSLNSEVKPRHFVMVYFEQFKFAVTSIHIRHSSYSKKKTKKKKSTKSIENNHNDASDVYDEEREQFSNENVEVTLKAIADRFEQLRTRKLENMYSSSTSSSTSSSISSSSISSPLQAEEQKLVPDMSDLKGILIIGDFNACVTAWDNKFVQCSDSLTPTYHISAQAPDGLTAYGGQNVFKAIDGAVWMQHSKKRNAVVPPLFDVDIITSP